MVWELQANVMSTPSFHAVRSRAVERAWKMKNTLASSNNAMF